MMSRYIVSLVLVLLLIVSIVVWFNLSDRISESDSSAYRFAVKDTSAIQKIFLTDRSGTRIVLERHQPKWILNEEYPARQNAIVNLMDAIRRVELKFIPTRAALDHMVKDLATHGVKVMIYGKKDHLLKSYYVGGVTPDERGTYMIMEGSEQPVVTHIAGWEGGLRSRYWMPPVEWRDRTVFAFSFEEIEEITVRYPEQDEESFHLKNMDSQIVVRPLQTRLKRADDTLLPGAGESYLREFRGLHAEAILENQILYDSIQTISPFAIISVLTTGDRLSTLELFPQREIQNENRAPIIERYYALSSRGDMFLVQHRIFKEILRGYSYFTSSDSPKDRFN